MHWVMALGGSGSFRLSMNFTRHGWMLVIRIELSKTVLVFLAKPSAIDGFSNLRTPF